MFKRYVGMTPNEYRAVN
ncbi:MAG: hypothetical protein LBL33_05765 [Tannerella sp.]|nr:hypothetical protein [Tannerella sp.]